MANIFTSVQSTSVGSNTFDLTHDKKLSTKMGRLTPICIIDTVPGDKIKINSHAFIRFAPMIAPVMHQINMYIHYFYVPHRILWSNFDDFITGGKNGTDASVPPYRAINLNSPTGNATSGLSDYLGLPTRDDVEGTDTTNREISPLPHATYQKIWNDYYRDQNLQQTEVNTDLSDGAMSTADWADMNLLRNRAWQHDYFTSSLPFTQKGPEALLPLTGDAPVKFDGQFSSFTQILRDSIGVNPNSGTIDSGAGGELSSSTKGLVNLDLGTSHYADLAAVTGTSIIDLRRAFKLQEYLEKNARGGTRINEFTMVHFGVKTSDGRLHRAEYLGGSSSPIKISEVLQTSETDTNTPQGNMAGHALGVGNSKSIAYTAEDYGYIMGIMSVMPRPTYQQGIPKHFLRKDRFDYFTPAFATIGEQAILDMEVYQEPTEDGMGTFGYTPRYAEYKFINSSVHGDMRTNLDFYHLGRKFSTMPALNEDFIVMDPVEVERIFAIQDETDNLWCHVINKVKATRKMPYFSDPKL